MTVESLTATLEMNLSRPPCRAGQRLKSERDLAKLFNIGESQVRRSLDTLVKKGVLVRKRGSGTFVRRVPDTSNSVVSAAAAEAAASLFCAEDDDSTIVSPRVQLHLGVWADYEGADRIQQLMLGFIARAVSASGHRLTVHSIIGNHEARTPMSIKALREQLLDNPCDGYFVISTMADWFLAALDGRKVPVIFYLYGSAPIVHEPLVMFNTNEAIERAVSKLACEGFTRIGMIGLHRPEQEVEKLYYDRAMQQLGINYRAAIFSDLGVGQAMAATRELLSHKPDAVYVSDDTTLVGVAEALAIEKIVPGRDIGIITLSNRGWPLPPGVDWSRLEFDRERFGHELVDNLLSLLQSAGSRVNTIALHSHWIPGQTHRKNT